MSRVGIILVGAWSITVLASANGCGAKAIDNIEGPSLRANRMSRPLSYESQRSSGGPLAGLSPDEARAAAQFLVDHPFPLLNCNADASAVVSCAADDCSNEINALDMCLALGSLRLPGDYILAQGAIGQGPLSARDCALFSRVFRSSESPSEELFHGLEDTRKAACDEIMAAASAVDECSNDQAADLNRCLADLAGRSGVAVVTNRVSSLREAAELKVDPVVRGNALAHARLVGWAVEPTSMGAPNIALPAVAAVPSNLESRIINGLADFLAKRAREEGLNYLAESVGKNLCERSVEGVQVSSFFPETCRLLRGRDGQADFGLSQFGSALQNGLERDLRALLPVMLNHATSKLDRTRWPALDRFLQAIMKTVTDGSPPGLEELLQIGKDQIMCDGKGDYACALQLICITALAMMALDEGRKTNECQALTWGQACINAATSDINAALEGYQNLKKWLDDRISADNEQRLRFLHALMDQVVEMAQARDRGEPTIGQFLALLRTGIDVVPAKQRERVHLLLGQLENGVIRWGELGYVVYHVTNAIIDGKDPTHTLVAAAENVSCTSLNDDVGCGVRASGYLVSALLSLQARWPKPGSPPKDVRQFLLDVEQRLAFTIGHPENLTLRAWMRTRFAVAVAPDDVTAKLPLTDIIEQLLSELRSLETALEKVSDPKTDRLVAVAAMLSTSASLLRNVVSMTIESEATRARALRVIDGIVAASTAGSRREFAPFMAALYALAVDLGVPDPLPEHVRKYIPFVTALTTADTSEQVSAAFERYGTPVGGYKAKQQPGRHYSVSALVGAAGGLERGISSNVDLAGQFSVFTPVGVDVTFGTKLLPGWGFMLSVLDLGTLTAARIDNSDDQEIDADVSFKQVFSPGLHLRVPLLGPAVLGAGLSMVPGLRRPNETGQAEAIFRGMLFVAVDVTLFEL